MIRRWRQLAPVLALLGVLISAGAARTEILTADLQVNGLTCPFCVFGIEKKLLDVDGVSQVEVSLDEGRLQLRLQPGNAATIAALERAVEKAGFELAGLAIEARGTIDIQQTATWLEVHEGLRLLLLESDGSRERPLSAASRDRLLVDEEGRVVASGRVLRVGEAPRLVVDLSRTAAMRRP